MQKARNHSWEVGSKARRPTTGEQAMRRRDNPQESCSATSRRTRGCPRSTRFARSSGTPVLVSMSAEFDRIYAERGRRSISPEHVLKESLLIVLVRSDRLTDRNLLSKVRRRELKIHQQSPADTILWAKGFAGNVPNQPQSPILAGPYPTTGCYATGARKLCCPPGANYTAVAVLIVREDLLA
jgi:hypothetical protein